MCDSKKYDISIVICTYNRSALLKKALDSVLNINTRPEISYEVIVIDNNSTDDTQSVVKSNEPKFDGRLKCFIELNKGLSNARNRGIKESEGGIIVFTDDDVKVDRDWILSI